VADFLLVRLSCACAGLVSGRGISLAGTEDDLTCVGDAAVIHVGIRDNSEIEHVIDDSLLI
jgi:hypothetical protein